MDPTDLNDLSLLILCDVATTANGKRLSSRFSTLLYGTASGSFVRGGVPKMFRDLEAAGMIQIHRSTPTTGAKAKGTEPGWFVTITDNGRLLHRCLVAALRNASVLTEAAKA